MKEKLLKYENGKLKQQLIFSIPANMEICNRACPGCYAMKFQRLYPSVLPYRERRYQASMQDDFVAAIISEIQACKKPLTAVRIHESGEWYSQEYIDKWEAIATALPHVTFYAFSKRLADFDFSTISKLNNVIIINSMKHGLLNYGKLPFLNTHPTTNICPATQKATKDITICGVTCTLCMTKSAQSDGVLFVQH